jgi:hypothetical protein
MNEGLTIIRHKLVQLNKILKLNWFESLELILSSRNSLLNLTFQNNIYFRKWP